MQYKVLITRNSDSKEFGPHIFNKKKKRQEYIDRILNDINLGVSPSSFTVDKTEDRSDELQSIYDAMVKDVYDEMENVFGTRNDVSASAFAATWEAMIKRPASYVDPELGFADESAVTAYANAKIAASDAYGVFRLKRIGQFESEKATILGA